jgi:RND superfamily putative drug exporter
VSRERFSSFFFERWPRFASRHPWYVLAGALVVLAGFVALNVVAGGRYVTSFDIPGSESQRLVDLLEERFPQTAGDAATVVVHAPDGLQNPEVRSRVGSLVADLGELPDVVGVSSPYEQAEAISPDGSIAWFDVLYADEAHGLERSSLDALADLRRRRGSLGLAALN